jgi:transcriptional/translational regulatory protein YebC/TACO1
MEAALEVGAEDVVGNDDGSVDVFTAPADFMTVKQGLADAGFEAEFAEVAMIPATTVELDVETARRVMKLIDALDDLDDSQNVFHNADIPEEAMEDD